MRLILSIFFAALVVSGCGGSPPATNSQAEAKPALSVTEYAAMVEHGEAFLIDVREENEIRSGMAEPAIWMPFSLIRREDAAWLTLVERFKAEPDKPVILYCSVGSRSAAAANGLSNVSVSTFNLGGYQTWVKAGLPTKRPQEPIPGQ